MQFLKGLNSEIQRLKEVELSELLDKAWEVRQKNFLPELNVSAPGLKRYNVEHFSNTTGKFINVSVTGSECSLHCDHCNAKLLESMTSAVTPEKLLKIGKKIKAQGGEGMLLSGGADVTGRVPFDDYYDAITKLKSLGLKVIVHSGLVGREEAEALKKAGVDQVLLDIIGDHLTINRVYHLNRKPVEYLSSMINLKRAGLEIAPHIVIGLHYGEIRGEYNALEMISSVLPDIIVFVVLTPKPETKMMGVKTPAPEEIARLIAMGRILNPEARVNLGCAKPASDKIDIENFAIRAGVNTIAYPGDETLSSAEKLGLKINYSEMCCTLV